MRRVGRIWRDVVSFESLCRAANRAARGSRSSLATAAFLDRLEPEVLALQRELQDETWQPGRAVEFRIHDPKPRIITAVPFRDRVVHHALIGALATPFDRRMIHDSYACRAGKGSHRAVARAREFSRRYPVFLKLDVAAFFASLQHDVVLETLTRIVKDRRALELARTIVAGARPRASPGRGLSIGALTSQWFANLVLDRLDHFVKEVLRVPGYLRYMDDFVLFADSRDVLRDAHGAVRGFLAESLRLALKDRATVLAPVGCGLPFLGWRIYPGVVRVQRRSLRRYRWRLRHRRWQLAQGRIDAATFRHAVAAVFSHLGTGDTLHLRRDLAGDPAIAW